VARLRVGVLFGGQSGEHDVSLMSGLSIIEGLKDRYEVIPIGITRSGQFLPGVDAARALAGGGVDPVAGERALEPLQSGAIIGPLDVVIPALHGPMGEDGTVQGLLELAGVPFVGSGVLGSAVSMDKAIMKEVFASHGLPVGPWRLVRESGWRRDPKGVADEVADLGYPVFVKPSNMGSSVGISRVADDAVLAAAIDGALAHDRRVVVEKAMVARELECAVLGNDHPETSVVGEIVPHATFYDYHAKYAEGGADLIVPANIPHDLEARVREYARQAFIAVDAAGLARVDFFLTGDGRVVLNEVNTFPGFTPFSMYPRLWAASGLSYGHLLDRLIDLAIERAETMRRKRQASRRNLP